MIAQGEHVLIRKPKFSDAGGKIAMPDGYEMGYAYGRVLSAGPLVGRECPATLINEHSDTIRDVERGDIVVFDPHGAREIELDGKKDGYLVVAHASQLFATITEKELAARNLPIP